MSWLAIFLSPTLLSIQDTNTPWEPLLDISAALTLLKKIKICCPALEELSLHPCLLDPPRESRLLVSSIFEHYSSMQNLQILAITMDFLDTSAVLALAKLPQLETLVISAVSYFSDPFPNIILPDGLFFMLRTLSLPMLMEDKFEYVWSIWELVTSLVVVKAEVFDVNLESDVEPMFGNIC